MKWLKNIWEDDRKFNILVTITFFTGVILIVSTYAWLSANLNAKVDFFNIVASNQDGLTISLDGNTFSSSVDISEDAIINDLKNTYANHTNQWAKRGLFPISTNGTQTVNNDKFHILGASKIAYKINSLSRKRYLNARVVSEEQSNNKGIFIAFDLFLKNVVSGSPKSDNLYLDRGTGVALTSDEYTDADGAINSVRFGFLKIGTTPLEANLDAVQNQTCNNGCEMVIYEPHSTAHSQASIDRARKYGVNLIPGIPNPTYALINPGDHLELANGQYGSGIKLDTEYFALQNTITSFNRPIFQIPEGITKVRVYVWLEGQDMDSIESFSSGSIIKIAINFIKDTAAYE